MLQEGLSPSFCWAATPQGKSACAIAVGLDFERYGCRPEAQRSVADPEIAAKDWRQDLGRRKAFLEKRVNTPVTPGGAEKIRVFSDKA